MRPQAILKKPKSALRAAAICLLCGVLATGALLRAQNSPASNSTPSDADASRGQKLILKDGSFQMVREYKVDGDRLSYYSLDTHQWEEMPAALVDWDATRKEASAQQKKDTALLNAVDAREKQQHAELLDVDASVEVGPGIFLPAAVGLYAFDGKAISPVAQAETKSTLNKRKFLEQVMVPVPVVPTQHNVAILGTHAKLRFKMGQPEFYMRPADTREPEIDLIRAKVHGNERQVEDLDELFGERLEKRNTVPLQRWQVAQGLYRYTLGQALAPGEYVLAETVPGEGMSLYVWDFGVDPPGK